jgi:mannan endo-1,4-beta-mannosidase
VAITPRHLLTALLGLLVALFLAVAATQTAEQANAAPRTGLGAARKLSTQNRCAKRIPARRARTMSLRQRRQLIRERTRGCAATQSTSPGAPLYWGATIGDQITGEQAPWDMGAVSKFESMAGKGVSLVNFFGPFANCASKCSFYKFPTEPMESIRQHGSIPVYSWSSQSIPSSLNEPDFQLSDVIAGNFDSYIREFAEDARDWGHPFFLRFNWEMNGNWFPWSEGVNGNQSGEFVAAWRHVHDIFTAVGASNVSWVWCPNVDPGNKLANSIASDYPGDQYVDWTGLDGYNWGPAQGGWTSFSHLYDSTYHAITDTIAPSKPLLIGEMGSTEKGGSKASWISEALAEIPTAFPKIRAMLWFDTFDDGMDWPIETSSSATSAFAAGIQAPAYQSNSYANLPPSAIAPPA